MTDEIILVDDDPVARIYISEALSAKGYKVTVFELPSLALDYSKSNNISLAILDTYMPEMSGIELFGKLRSEAKSKNLRVIIMSADKDCFDLLEQASLIADKVLLKPIKINTLLEAISEFSES